jgi:hypothetical protein
MKPNTRIVHRLRPSGDTFILNNSEQKKLADYVEIVSEAWKTIVINVKNY